MDWAVLVILLMPSGQLEYVVTPYEDEQSCLESVEFRRDATAEAFPGSIVECVQMTPAPKNTQQG